MGSLNGSLAGKRILIVGSGESGLSSLSLIRRWGAKLSLSTLERLGADKIEALSRAGVRVECGRHSLRFLRGNDLIVLSPGVRPQSPLIRRARRLGIPFMSEVQLAFGFVRGPWVGVTGTNGKTTVCHLLKRILSRNGAWDLAGNVGKSLSRSVLSRGPDTPRIVELSSFQLYSCHGLHPRVAAILNLAPNHLDWHPSLEHYYGAKLNLIRSLGKGGVAVLNHDDPVLMRLTRLFRVRKYFFSHRPLKSGIYVHRGVLYEASGGSCRRLFDLGPCKLKGEHNEKNIMAAVAVARLLGISPVRIREALGKFQPLPHRAEIIGSHREVLFVNDSKSTTVASTVSALKSLDRKIILIAGGRAKERDFGHILPLLCARCAGLVIYGESAALIARELSPFEPKVRVRTLKEAFEKALRLALPGEEILLSPMCASFDQFDSYEERGNRFRSLFDKLKAGARSGHHHLR